MHLYSRLLVEGNAAMVSFLVKECYADLEERGRYIPYEPMTPLLCAALLNNIEAAKSLIDLGADINAVSSCGSYTPLLFACGKWTPTVAEYLIRHGADTEKRKQIRRDVSNESGRIKRNLPTPHR